MSILRCLSTMYMASANPKDIAVNTFFVRTQSAATLTDTGNITTAWQTFMRSWQSYMSQNVAVTGHSIKYYDMADSEPRVPLDEGTWNLTAVGGDAAPPELAVCISYNALYVSGVPKARARGRMYMGPVSKAACTSPSGAPNATFQQGLVTNMKAMWTSLNGNALEFGVYSTVDQAFRACVRTWSDNAFDIQRRRGYAPTSRTALSFP